MSVVQKVMSPLVTEEPIGGGYVQVSFAGSTFLILHEERGFFNPNQLCKRAGKKICDYNKLSSKKNLELALQNYSTELCYKVDRGRRLNNLILGWYLHPTLLLDLALWLSPEAFATAAIIIRKIFSRGKDRRSKWSNLLECGELKAFKSANVRPPKWHMQYSNLNFIVNERGWFDAAQFCATHRRRLGDFERRADSSRFIEYLRSRDLIGGEYYHPLLFLRLAAWVSSDYFVKCVRIVFCGGVKRLDLGFRKAFRELLSKPGQPATTGGWRRPAESEEDTEVESTDEETDDDVITREEHERQMAALKRQLTKAEERVRQRDAEYEELQQSFGQMRFK